MGGGAVVGGFVGGPPPRDWLALDDTYDGWPEHCIDNFIATDEVYGISEPKVRERIVQKLAALGK